VERIGNLKRVIVSYVSELQIRVDSRKISGAMIARDSLQTFSSFEEADIADREERHSLSYDELLIALEQLRSYMYPHGETPPRLQRLFEFTQ